MRKSSPFVPRPARRRSLRSSGHAPYTTACCRMPACPPMDADPHLQSRPFAFSLSFLTVKRVAVCAILFAMPIRSSVVPPSPRPSRTNSLADQPQVREALDWLDKNLDWTTEQQVRLTEIPAPSFQEEKRAETVK